jgi:hypothetical protein
MVYPKKICHRYKKFGDLLKTVGGLKETVLTSVLVNFSLLGDLALLLKGVRACEG